MENIIKRDTFIIFSIVVKIKSKGMKIYIADNQDITRAGLLYIISQRPDCESKHTPDKTSLIEALKDDRHVVIILDYTLFDINDAAELSIISQRFPEAQWILFSEDLSHDFLRQIVLVCPKCGIVLKDCSLAEIREAIDFASKGKRYICQQIMELLLAAPSKEETLQKEPLPNLTKTELEILRDITLGMTTKEIAQKRFSSFHTINTHRKNIFRKLGVNNVHEATKFALRAGLVDAAEYYI